MGTEGIEPPAVGFSQTYSLSIKHIFTNMLAGADYFTIKRRTPNFIITL